MTKHFTRWKLIKITFEIKHKFNNLQNKHPISLHHIFIHSRHANDIINNREYYYFLNTSDFASTFLYFITFYIFTYTYSVAINKYQYNFNKVFNKIKFEGEFELLSWWGRCPFSKIMIINMFNVLERSMGSIRL